jgi:hypothetical protein
MFARTVMISVLLLSSAACSETTRVVEPETTAASLSVTTPQVDLSVGVSLPLSTQLRSGDGRLLHNRPLTYTSSNAAVVRVSAQGILTAVSVGSAVVTVNYGTLSARATVDVSGTASGYRIASYNGAALPVVISDDTVTRADGSTVQLIEKFESGNVALNGAYQIELHIGVYERTTSNGRTTDRFMRRNFLRDSGQLQYNWLDGSATLLSERVGGLTHRLESSTSGPQLAFRIGGTYDVWTLNLQLQQ